MKILLLIFVVGCSQQGGGSPDAAATSHDATIAHDAPIAHDAASQASCVSDDCVCPMNLGCTHACTPGGFPCHVQCAPNESCDVTCDSAEECHVEASSTTQTTVDCAGSPECHVTCPATGCTVENCIGATCVVSCGLAGQATRTGTTATCP